MPTAKIPLSEGIRVTVSPLTEPYWLGTRDKRLLAAQCASCGHFRMPFLPFCPSCNEQAVAWKELDARATIYSFTFYPHPNRSAAQDDSVLAPAVVEFAQAPGIRYAGNVVDMDCADIRIGMDVEVDWVFNADGWGLPVFRPLKAQS